MEITELKSKTGRKMRKDSFELNHDMTLVENILKKLYLEDRLSTTQIPEIIKKEHKIDISSVKCFYILQKLGVLRGKSEAISIATSTLDYSKVILTDELENIINGIMISDGGMDASHKTKVARVNIAGSKEEFINYCYKLLKPYEPLKPKFNPPSDSNRKSGTGTWNISTKFHPDLS